MPQKDGLQTIKELRAAENNGGNVSRLPVCGVTGECIGAFTYPSLMISGRKRSAGSTRNGFIGWHGSMSG